MQNVTYEQAKKLIKEDEQCIFIDVRNPMEYEEGHIDGAILIPLYELEYKVKKMLPNKKRKIIVYCMSGNRSKLAFEKLQSLGYENIYNLKDGLQSVYYRSWFKKLWPFAPY